MDASSVSNSTSYLVLADWHSNDTLTCKLPNAYVSKDKGYYVQIIPKGFENVYNSSQFNITFFGEELTSVILIEPSVVLGDSLSSVIAIGKTFENRSTLVCGWGDSFYERTNATFINDTALSCDVPLSVKSFFCNPCIL